MSKGRILVIDDERDMLENCSRLLQLAGFEAFTLSEPRRAREVLSDLAPDALLLDLRMPGVDGMTVLTAVLAEDPALPVIIMTAFATVPSAVQAIREGAFDYLAKPFSAEQLSVAVERAVRYRGLTIENRELRDRLGSGSGLEAIVGSSPALARVLEQARKVGPSDAGVLITGESGTGKELLARCLHALSQRRAGPFIPIDSASLPEQLLETELFGHEKGAFTGAVARKTGLLVEATGGTAFLDEIGELSPTLQAKLLRTLEERRVRPVGSTSLVPIDIRVIAATNVDLAGAVAEGRFRSDLYYRLNVVELRLPPLRERTGDIPTLVHRFVAQFASQMGRPVPRISPEACEALEQYAWPGNVRELRNLAQRTVVLDEDGRITLSDLPEHLRQGVPAPPPPEAGTLPAYESARDRALVEFRRVYLERLLQQHDGNISHAARAAGLSRRTLHRWLAQEQLVDPHTPVEEAEET